MEKHKEREKRRTEKINCSGANVSIGKLCYDEIVGYDEIMGSDWMLQIM